MSAFLYGVALQCRIDIRSKALLITCYAVPLLFFLLMGGIFTAVDPGAKKTLIPSMTVLGVSMGSLVGLPPSLAEIYGGGVKKIYKANGVPLYLGLASVFLSAFFHLFLMSLLLYLAAPLFFGASLPADPLSYFASLAVFLAASCGIGSVLGLSVKNQAKLTMISQMVFLPSIMLSGILFPSELLPGFLAVLGKAFPTFWGFQAMLAGGFSRGASWPLGALWPLAVFLAAAAALCGLLLRRMSAE